MKRNCFFTAMSGATLAFGILFGACSMDDGSDPVQVAEDPYTAIPIPDSEDTLAKALAWISGNAEADGAYTVTVKAGETIPAQSLSYGGKRVSVSLRGDAAGREAVLDGTGSLFTVESGVTLHVENLTLKGRGNSESFANDSALVRVGSGGALRLKAGALITGNYNASRGSDGDGGGVRVEGNASFTMEGGTIKDNTAANNAGGVYVKENTVFTMKGGTISGNTAGNGSGGGVRVANNAVFTMEGGEINGNTAKSGGGVSVGENSTFTKKGGTIYGDTDTSHTPGNTENTATGGYGHAVQLDGGDKKRNATAGPEVKLYVKNEEGSGWTYSGGGVGDTTANWE